MKKNARSVTAIIIIAALAITAVIPAAFAAWTPRDPKSQEDASSIYQKPDVNALTGEGAPMRELSSEVSAYGVEKQWYEYVIYAEEPVGYYYLSRYQRLAFYDPYDYADALIMNISDVATASGSEWSSASSINISYQTGTSCEYGRGTEQSTSYSESISESSSVGGSSGTEISEGETTSATGDVSLSTSESVAATVSSDTTVEVSNTIQIGASTEATVGGSVGVGDTGVSASTSVGTSLTDSLTTSISEKIGVSATATVGATQVVSVGTGKSDTKQESTSESSNWSKVSEMAKETTNAYSSSFNNSWSTNDSVSISRDFDAAHFNTAGVPYQWKIVAYTLFMPVYVELQIDTGDEWVATDSCYCRLNTIQGTCRAWIQNNIVYYEHWGTSEPVVWDDFWDGFFTTEELKNAYKNCPWPED